MINVGKKTIIPPGYLDTRNLQSALGGDLRSIWYPPAQPESAAIMPLTTYDPVAYINTLWEPLRLQDPGYIKRTNLGKDQSGTYDIWKYEFTPEHFEKTIILGANVHGGEMEGQKILYRFMWHIVNDHQKYSQLNYLRNKVRIIVLPIQNPYGLSVQTRQNSRNVDINRNYNYRWNQYVSTPDTPKGSAPLSEAETIIIDSVMQQYSDAVAYIDIHNTSPAATPAYYSVVPNFGKSHKDIVLQIINSIKPTNTNDILIQHTIEPMGCCHAAVNYNLHSSTIEWVPGALSGTAFNAMDIQYGLTYVGNMILQYCAMNKPSYMFLGEAKTVEMFYGSTIPATTNLNYEKITQFDMEFIPTCEGILLVNGTISTHNTDATALTYIAPVVVQDQNDVIALSSVSDQQIKYEVYGEFSGKRGTLPFTRATKVYPVSNGKGNVKFSLYWKTTAGSIGHRRTRINFTFIPSQAADRYTSFTNDGAGAVYQFYPPLT